MQINPYLLCTALFFIGCQKKDKEPPAIKVVSPINNTSVNSGESVEIVLEVRDNQQVQTLSITRINTTNFGIGTNIPGATEILRFPDRTIGKQSDTIRFTQKLSKSLGSSSIPYSYTYTFTVKDASGNQGTENLGIILP